MVARTCSEEDFVFLVVSHDHLFAVLAVEVKHELFREAGIGRLADAHGHLE